MELEEESPLDVLSRAATMVQKTQGLATWPTPDTSKSNTTNQKQTTKWKRDRRGRLPEYTRKSDPKFSETFGMEAGSDTNGTRQQILHSGTQNGNGPLHDTPLDMSLRQRGEPPSYAQTISNPGYRSNYRPSVIHNGGPQVARDELPLGISMCDPIIDEHFRRSLGSDYNTIFQNNNVAKESPPPRRCSPPSPKVQTSTTTASSVIELMDSAGMSVDDHFAKALGDTWAKLNRKESDMKRDTAKENLVTI